MCGGLLGRTCQRHILVFKLLVVSFIVVQLGLHNAALVDAIDVAALNGVVCADGWVPYSLCEGPPYYCLNLNR